MESKLRLDDIVATTFTAIPRRRGLTLSKADLTNSFDLSRVTISIDHLTNNQWVSLLTNGKENITDAALRARFGNWTWRRVGTDRTDLEEVLRFRATLQGNIEVDGEQSEGRLLSHDPRALSPANTSSAGTGSSEGPTPPVSGADHPSAVNVQSGGPVERVHNPPLHRLPVEIITIILNLVLKSSSLTMLDHNAKVEEFRLVCKRWHQIIDNAKQFWLQITSRCSSNFNKEAVRRWFREENEGPSLNIELAMRSADSRPVKKVIRGLRQFIKLVDPYKSKWTSLNAALPSDVSERLWKHFDKPVPHLKSLSVCIIESSDREHFVAYKPMALLGAEGTGLKDLKLVNVPINFDPSPFTALQKLQVSGVTRIPLTEIATLLSHAIELKVLELVDIQTTTAPLLSSWQDSIHAQSLRSLTLRDLSKAVNLFILLLRIDAPNLQHLDVVLDVAEGRFGDDFPNAMNTLATRIASVVQARKGPSFEAVSHVRLGLEDEGYEWWSQCIDLDGQSVGFHMLLRFRESDEIDPVVYVSYG
ncbi:hypothetical protein FRB90_012177 [Tulasnella sp. 427]|nr:hypothetical protein FRB90_012177 [Tulasnella sp. 427]